MLRCWMCLCVCVRAACTAAADDDVGGACYLVSSGVFNANAVLLLNAKIK